MCLVYKFLCYHQHMQLPIWMCLDASAYIELDCFANLWIEWEKGRKKLWLGFHIKCTKPLQFTWFASIHLKYQYFDCQYMAKSIDWIVSLWLKRSTNYETNNWFFARVFFLLPLVMQRSDRLQNKFVPIVLQAVHFVVLLKIDDPNTTLMGHVWNQPNLLVLCIWVDMLLAVLYVKC